MRVKKATKPARSLRYLLFADRRLQRISLRKMTERVKKAKPAARSTRKNGSSSSEGAKKPSGSSWPFESWAIIGGVLTVVIAATLITAGQPSPEIETAAASDTAATAARLERPAARPPAERKAVAPAASTTAAPSKSAASAPPSAPAATKATASNATAVAPAPEPVAETAAKATQDVPPVAITGCLELDNETYWLKDTSGVDAPKSRSWRSGFLKRRPAPIEVVDAGKTLKLQSYVGQRVVATGPLVDGEMRAQSLRRVAASCK